MSSAARLFLVLAALAARAPSGTAQVQNLFSYNAYSIAPDGPDGSSVTTQEQVNQLTVLCVNGESGELWGANGVRLVYDCGSTVYDIDTKIFTHVPVISNRVQIIAGETIGNPEKDIADRLTALSGVTSGGSSKRKKRDDATIDYIGVDDNCIKYNATSGAVSSEEFCSEFVLTYGKNETCNTCSSSAADRAYFSTMVESYESNATITITPSSSDASSTVLGTSSAQPVVGSVQTASTSSSYLGESQAVMAAVALVATTTAQIQQAMLAVSSNQAGINAILQQSVLQTSENNQAVFDFLSKQNLHGEALSNAVIASQLASEGTANRLNAKNEQLSDMVQGSSERVNQFSVDMKNALATATAVSQLSTDFKIQRVYRDLTVLVQQTLSTIQGIQLDNDVRTEFLVSQMNEALNDLLSYINIHGSRLAWLEAAVKDMYKAQIKMIQQQYSQGTLPIFFYITKKRLEDRNYQIIANDDGVPTKTLNAPTFLTARTVQFTKMASMDVPRDFALLNGTVVSYSAEHVYDTIVYPEMQRLYKSSVDLIRLTMPIYYHPATLKARGGGVASDYDTYVLSANVGGTLYFYLHGITKATNANCLASLNDCVKDVTATLGCFLSKTYIQQNNLGASLAKFYFEIKARDDQPYLAYMPFNEQYVLRENQAIYIRSNYSSLATYLTASYSASPVALQFTTTPTYLNFSNHDYTRGALLSPTPFASFGFANVNGQGEFAANTSCAAGLRFKQVRVAMTTTAATFAGELNNKRDAPRSEVRSDDSEPAPSETVRYQTVNDFVGRVVQESVLDRLLVKKPVLASADTVWRNAQQQQQQQGTKKRDATSAELDCYEGVRTTNYLASRVGQLVSTTCLSKPGCVAIQMASAQTALVVSPNDKRQTLDVGYHELNIGDVKSILVPPGYRAIIRAESKPNINVTLSFPPCESYTASCAFAVPKVKYEDMTKGHNVIDFSRCLSESEANKATCSEFDENTLGLKFYKARTSALSGCGTESYLKCEYSRSLLQYGNLGDDFSDYTWAMMYTKEGQVNGWDCSGKNPFSTSKPQNMGVQCVTMPSSQSAVNVTRAELDAFFGTTNTAYPKLEKERLRYAIHKCLGNAKLPSEYDVKMPTSDPYRSTKALGLHLYNKLFDGRCNLNEDVRSARNRESELCQQYGVGSQLVLERLYQMSPLVEYYQPHVKDLIGKNYDPDKTRDWVMDSRSYPMLDDFSVVKNFYHGLIKDSTYVTDRRPDGLSSNQLHLRPGFSNWYPDVDLTPYDEVVDTCVCPPGTTHQKGTTVCAAVSANISTYFMNFEVSGDTQLLWEVSAYYAHPTYLSLTEDKRPTTFKITIEETDAAARFWETCWPGEAVKDVLDSKNTVFTSVPGIPGMKLPYLNNNDSTVRIESVYPDILDLSTRYFYRTYTVCEKLTVSACASLPYSAQCEVRMDPATRTDTCYDAIANPSSCVGRSLYDCMNTTMAAGDICTWSFGSDACRPMNVFDLSSGMTDSTLLIPCSYRPSSYSRSRCTANAVAPTSTAAADRGHACMAIVNVFTQDYTCVDQVYLDPSHPSPDTGARDFYTALCFGTDTYCYEGSAVSLFVPQQPIATVYQTRLDVGAALTCAGMVDPGSGLTTADLCARKYHNASTPACFMAQNTCMDRCDLIADFDACVIGDNAQCTWLKDSVDTHHGRCTYLSATQQLALCGQDTLYGARCIGKTNACSVFNGDTCVSLAQSEGFVSDLAFWQPAPADGGTHCMLLLDNNYGATAATTGLNNTVYNKVCTERWKAVSASAGECRNTTATTCDLSVDKFRQQIQTLLSQTCSFLTWETCVVNKFSEQVPCVWVTTLSGKTGRCLAQGSAQYNAILDVGNYTRTLTYADILIDTRTVYADVSTYVSDLDTFYNIDVVGTSVADLGARDITVVSDVSVRCPSVASGELAQLLAMSGDVFFNLNGTYAPLTPSPTDFHAQTAEYHNTLPSKFKQFYLQSLDMTELSNEADLYLPFDDGRVCCGFASSAASSGSTTATKAQALYGCKEPATRFLNPYHPSHIYRRASLKAVATQWMGHFANRDMTRYNPYVASLEAAQGAVAPLLTTNHSFALFYTCQVVDNPFFGVAGEYRDAGLNDSTTGYGCSPYALHNGAQSLDLDPAIPPVPLNLDEKTRAISGIEDRTVDIYPLWDTDQDGNVLWRPTQSVRQLALYQIGQSEPTVFLGELIWDMRSSDIASANDTLDDYAVTQNYHQIFNDQSNTDIARRVLYNRMYYGDNPVLWEATIPSGVERSTMPAQLFNGQLFTNAQVATVAYASNTTVPVQYVTNVRTNCSASMTVIYPNGTSFSIQPEQCDYQTAVVVSNLPATGDLLISEKIPFTTDGSHWEVINVPSSEIACGSTDRGKANKVCYLQTFSPLVRTFSAADFLLQAQNFRASEVTNSPYRYMSTGDTATTIDRDFCGVQDTLVNDDPLFLMLRSSEFDYVQTMAWKKRFATYDPDWLYDAVFQPWSRYWTLNLNCPQPLSNQFIPNSVKDVLGEWFDLWETAYKALGSNATLANAQMFTSVLDAWQAAGSRYMCGNCGLAKYGRLCDPAFGPAIPKKVVDTATTIQLNSAQGGLCQLSKTTDIQVESLNDDLARKYRATVKSGLATGTVVYNIPVDEVWQKFIVSTCPVVLANFTCVGIASQCSIRVRNTQQYTLPFVVRTTQNAAVTDQAFTLASLSQMDVTVLVSEGDFTLELLSYPEHSACAQPYTGTVNYTIAIVKESVDQEIQSSMNQLFDTLAQMLTYDKTAIEKLASTITLKLANSTLSVPSLTDAVLARYLEESANGSASEAVARFNEHLVVFVNRTLAYYNVSAQPQLTLNETDVSRIVNIIDQYKKDQSTLDARINASETIFNDIMDRLDAKEQLGNNLTAEVQAGIDNLITLANNLANSINLSVGTINQGVGDIQTSYSNLSSANKRIMALIYLAIAMGAAALLVGAGLVGAQVYTKVAKRAKDKASSAEKQESVKKDNDKESESLLSDSDDSQVGTVSGFGRTAFKRR